MSEWNPTDDELHAIVGNPDYSRGEQALARLVLRERETCVHWRTTANVATNNCADWMCAAEQAEAERDRLKVAYEDAAKWRDIRAAQVKILKGQRDTARAALARVEAFADLCTDITAREIRAAIAGDTPAACSVAEHMDAATSAVPCICQREDTPPAAGCPDTWEWLGTDR